MERRKVSVADRFWSKVVCDLATGCWLWTRAVDEDGYGVFQWATPRSLKKAHRVAWWLTNGKWPSETLDHLCRVRRCVRPDHTEDVGGVVNVMRGDGPLALNARKTHCLRGHPFDTENTYLRPSKTGRPARVCRTCQAVAQKAWNSHRGMSNKNP